MNDCPESCEAGGVEGEEVLRTLDRSRKLIGVSGASGSGPYKYICMLEVEGTIDRYKATWLLRSPERHEGEIS